MPLTGSLRKHYVLKGVFLDNLIFVLRSELLACGQMNGSNDSHQAANGVILHSYDGGLTWSIVHLSSNTEHFNGIALDDRWAVWAIGEKGVVVKLHRLN